VIGEVHKENHEKGDDEEGERVNDPCGQTDGGIKDAHSYRQKRVEEGGGGGGGGGGEEEKIEEKETYIKGNGGGDDGRSDISDPDISLFSLKGGK